jgi:CO/xanthine dehydrogenase Mo-binding subunit
VPDSTRVVGQRLPKLDAPEKVSGRVQYADDLHIPGLLTGAILRSPHAHARIVRVDTTRAAALPGVKAVIHAGNVEQRPFGFDHDNLPLKDHTVRCRCCGNRPRDGAPRARADRGRL